MTAKLKALAALLKAEPAVFSGLVQAAIAIGTSLGLNLTAAEQGVLLAATTAGLTLLVAAVTRPFPVSALTGFATALGTALIAFGVPHVTPGAVSSVNAFAGILVTILVSIRVTPVATLKKAAAEMVTLTASVGNFDPVDTDEIARKVAARLAALKTDTVPAPVMPPPVVPPGV